MSLYNIATPYLVLAVFFPLNHKSDITSFTSAGVDSGHDSVKGLAISIDQNLGSPVVLLGPRPASSPCCFCIYLHRQQTTIELSRMAPGQSRMFTMHGMQTFACYANDIGLCSLTAASQGEQVI